MIRRSRPFWRLAAFRASRATMLPSHAVIDLMVQRSAVDLFASLGVSIAPTSAALAARGPSPKERSAAEDLIVTVQVTVNGKRGSLTLAVPPKALERAKGQMGRSGLTDSVRELGNQLAGRIKNRLARYRVPVEMGLPSVFTRSTYRQPVGEAPGLVYLFHTLTEDIQIDLSSHFAELDLRYDGSVDIAEEGDLLLF